ncbi:MAG: hypothetical protein NPINA01_27860 [Nitrospinaceae bacterium]|nr:MAG: hypothetical protein NPINA01_27860 [Nitrospinaceae bacterium]
MREFLFNLEIKQFFSNIAQKIALFFQGVTEQLGATLGPYFQKILTNPLAAGFTLVALITIPIIVFKVKKSKSEAESEGRLDELMEEMKGFEMNGPMMGLDKNYDDAPLNDLEPYHEENLENMDFEMDEMIPEPDQKRDKLEPDSMIELPSLISNDEPEEIETSLFSEQWETADELLANDSNENRFKRDDRKSESEHLTKDDIDWSQISRPSLSEDDDADMTIEEIENLQKEMESSVQRLVNETSFEHGEEDFNREIEFDPSPQVPEPSDSAPRNENPEETVSTTKSENHQKDRDIPAQPEEPVFTKSEEIPEPTVAREEHFVPSEDEDTVEENFENPFEPEPMVAVSATSVKESKRVQPAALKPNLKSQTTPLHTRLKSPENDYRGLLESFILLKNQKR